MKNYPLSLQIWIVIAIITIFISGILVFILPYTLRDFFTNEMYRTIGTAQEYFNESSAIRDNNNYPDFFIDREFINEDTQRVKHFILYSDGRFSTDSNYNNFIPLTLIEKSRDDISRQRDVSKEYVLSLADEKIFYIITKATLEQDIGPIRKSEPVFLVSFLNDSYREDLVQTLFNKLISLTFLILFLSWIPAIFFSKLLSNPLVSLEKKVVKLTDRKWDEEIGLDRKDEIGRLGNSIEKLRKELIRQDKSEQAFLQNISHELKTPIMVIKSYSQAISDGIFPEGDLESSLKIIDEETNRLEERVQSLLYITKLDYMANFQICSEDFLLDELIYSTVKKLALRNPNIQWDLQLSSLNINADVEQMQIVIENILDNAIRYATSTVSISITAIENGHRIRFWNDGEGLSEDSLSNIFEKFHKGKDGEIGLGLSIVKRIIDIHNFKIFAINEDNGVSFNIDMV